MIKMKRGGLLLDLETNKSHDWDLAPVTEQRGSKFQEMFLVFCHKWPVQHLCT